MTREHKLALILGFALVLVVGVLVSDHISGSQRSVASTQSMDDPVRAIESEYGPGLGLVAHLPRDRQLRGSDAPVDLDEPETTLAGGDGIGGVVERIQDELDKLASDPPPAVVQPASRPENAQEQPKVSEPEVFVIDPTQQSQGDRDRRSVATARTHRVAKGETLWAIAERYYGDGKFSVSLAEWNAASLGPRGTIRPGDQLAIPSRAELDGAVARGSDPGPIHDPIQKKPEPRPQAQARVYVVKKNDVLSTIAQRELGTVKRMDEILRLNRDKIDSPDQIWVGLELKLPAT